MPLDKYWNHETAVPIYAFEHNTATAGELEDTRSSLAEFAESQKKSRYADDVRVANFSVAFDSEASLHTKVFIFDREIVFIGSLNRDPRSIDINTEAGVIFHSPEMASRWANELKENTLEHVYELELVKSPAESRGEFTFYTWNIEWLERMDDKTVRHEKEPGIGVWDRILLFLKGLVPEGQL